MKIGDDANTIIRKVETKVNREIKQVQKGTGKQQRDAKKASSNNSPKSNNTNNG